MPLVASLVGRNRDSFSVINILCVDHKKVVSVHVDCFTCVWFLSDFFSDVNMSDC